MPVTPWAKFKKVCAIYLFSNAVTLVSNASTLVSKVSIFVIASCNAPVNKGTNFDWSIPCGLISLFLHLVTIKRKNCEEDPKYWI